LLVDALVLRSVTQSPHRVVPPRVRRCLGALGLCWLATTASLAVASELPDSSAKAQAVEKYRQGSQAYSDRRYKDAIDLFLDADALVGGNPALAYNTALAYEAMGDDSNALRWAREYLRRSPEASDRQDVQQIIDGLEARLQAKGIQQVTVISQPPGAVIAIDQQRLGVTPWTGELRPGRHLVSLTLEGHAASERSFDLGAVDALELRLTLSPEERTTRSSRTRGLVIGGATGLGAAVAAFGAAIGLEVARSGEEDKARSAQVQVESMRHLETMEDFQLGSRVAAGVGGALVIGGATLLIVGLVSDGDTSEQPVTAGCGPDGCSMMLRGVF
jgi:hypothetical protein